MCTLIPSILKGSFELSVSSKSTDNPEEGMMLWKMGNLLRDRIDLDSPMTFC